MRTSPFLSMFALFAVGCQTTDPVTAAPLPISEDVCGGNFWTVPAVAMSTIPTSDAACISPWGSGMGAIQNTCTHRVQVVGWFQTLPATRLYDVCASMYAGPDTTVCDAFIVNEYGDWNWHGAGSSHNTIFAQQWQHVLLSPKHDFPGGGPLVVTCALGGLYGGGTVGDRLAWFAVQ
jgi:hypothetical protein